MSVVNSERPSREEPMTAPLDPAVQPEVKDPILEVDALSLWYGSSQALREISLRIPARKTPNGLERIEIGYTEIRVDMCTEYDGIWLNAGEPEAVSKHEKSGLDKLCRVFKK